MSEFWTISAKALEEAEASTKFQLKLPEKARPSGNGHRWTEVVDIESVEAVFEGPGENRQGKKHGDRFYLEVAVRVAGETFSPENIGKAFSKRFYVPKDPITDGQKQGLQISLARVNELLRLAGVEKQDLTPELMQEYFTVGSPLVGTKCVVEVYQHPNKEDATRVDIDMTRFIRYE